jgi:hypothetical protein
MAFYICQPIIKLSLHSAALDDADWGNDSAAPRDAREGKGHVVPGTKPGVCPDNVRNLFTG